MVIDAYLVDWIENLPKSSKILVTSCSDHLQKKKLISLDRLDETWARQLICDHLELQPNDYKEELQNIVEVMQGHLLAIKLVLGYVRAWGLQRVMTDLRVIGGGESVCEQLLVWFWGMMSEDASALLMVTTFFGGDAGREALGKVSGLSSDFLLDAAILELIGLRLLDNRDPLVGMPRYSIHMRREITRQLRDAMNRRKTSVMNIMVKEKECMLA